MKLIATRRGWWPLMTLKENWTWWHVIGYSDHVLLPNSSGSMSPNTSCRGAIFVVFLDATGGSLWEAGCWTRWAFTWSINIFLTFLKAGGAEEFGRLPYSILYLVGCTLRAKVVVCELAWIPYIKVCCFWQIFWVLHLWLEKLNSDSPPSDLSPPSVSITLEDFP